MLMKVSTQPRFEPVHIGKLDGMRAIVQPVDRLMSSHAGIGMIGHLERRFGLLSELSERVNDPRLIHLIDHGTADIIIQRVSQISGGYSDGNDCDWLRFDPAIKWSLDRHPILGQDGASQETTCRFELAAITKSNRRKVLNTLIDHYIKHHKKPPKEITIGRMAQ